MRVRNALPDDADAIAGVHVRAWQVAYAHVFPPERLAELDVGARARLWRDWLERGAEAYVTEDCAGFVSVGASRDPDAEGELYAIYVDPERWGCGCGRALMVAALGALRAKGFSDAVLWVLDDNPRARRFYEAAGWTLDGAEKQEEHLGVAVREVRYRISLR